jgi:hypothetical protein
MANTAKVLFRGVATTTLTTNLYTVPSATTAVITSIAVCNAGAAAADFTLSIGPAGSEIKLFDEAEIAADTTTIIDLKQVLTAAQVIDGGATSTDVSFHISGMEIA